MAEQDRNGEQNENADRKSPERDVQPWLGWAAAAIVVLIVVVAVAMGLERSNRTDSDDTVVSMTPIVGGMSVATAAVDETDGGADAASPAANPEAEDSSVVTVTVPLTAADGVTATAALTVDVDVTATGTVSEEQIVASAAVTETVVVTGEQDVQAEPTATAAPTATPQPTATPPPTATPTRSAPPPVFAVGDLIVNESDGVALRADSTQESLVLDTINPGVAVTVVEPSGADLSYPVENDGYGWVRVRSADGLVGWAITDGMSRVP